VVLERKVEVLADNLLGLIRPQATTVTKPPIPPPEIKRAEVSDPYHLGGPSHQPDFRCVITPSTGDPYWGPVAHSKQEAKALAQQLILGDVVTPPLPPFFKPTPVTQLLSLPGFCTWVTWAVYMVMIMQIIATLLRFRSQLNGSHGEVTETDDLSARVNFNIRGRQRRKGSQKQKRSTTPAPKVEVAVTPKPAPKRAASAKPKHKTKPKAARPKQDVSDDAAHLAARAAAALVKHQQNPFDNPPVSIGGSGFPNAIFGQYSVRSVTIAAASAINDVLVTLSIGNITSNSALNVYTQTTANAGAVAYTGSGGTTTAISWFNQSAASNIVGTVRPISGCVKVSMAYGQITPPVMFAGCVTAVGNDTTISGSVPNTLFQSGSNVKGQATDTCATACWVPQDFNDIQGFTTTGLTAMFSGTTLPYIGITGINSQAMRLTVEAIQFFEFQPTTLAMMQYFIPTKQVGYSVNGMWSAFVNLSSKGRGPKQVVYAPPRHGHKHSNGYFLGAANSVKSHAINSLPAQMPFSSDLNDMVLNSGEHSLDHMRFEAAALHVPAAESRLQAAWKALKTAGFAITLDALAKLATSRLDGVQGDIENQVGPYVAPPAAFVEAKQPASDEPLVKAVAEAVAQNPCRGCNKPSDTRVCDDCYELFTADRMRPAYAPSREDTWIRLNLRERSQLNGSHGEVTETDDLSYRPKGRRERQEKRQALSKRHNEICKKCHVELDWDNRARKSFCPVCDTSDPSGYSSDDWDEKRPQCEGAPDCHHPKGDCPLHDSCSLHPAYWRVNCRPCADAIITSSPYQSDEPGKTFTMADIPDALPVPVYRPTYSQVTSPGTIVSTVEPLALSPKTTPEAVVAKAEKQKKKPCLANNMFQMGLSKYNCRRPKCPYSHAKVEKIATHCDRFLAGKCKLDDQCPYTHPPRARSSPTPPSTISLPPSASESPVPPPGGPPGENGEPTDDPYSADDVHEDIVYVYVVGSHVPTTARYTHRLPCHTSDVDEHVYGPLLTDIDLPVESPKTIIFLHCVSLIDPDSLSIIIQNWGSVKSVDHDVSHVISMVDGSLVRIADSCSYTVTREGETTVLPLPTHPVHPVIPHHNGTINVKRVKSPKGYVAACYTNGGNDHAGFEVTPSIHDVSYYGPLSLAPTAHAKQSVDEDSVTVRVTKHFEGSILQSYGQFVVFHSAEHRQYIVPKTYVHVAHRAAIGQMRDPELLQLVLRRLKSFDELTNRDQRLEPNAIFIAAVLGIMSQVDAEADVLHGSLPAKTAIIKAHSQALQFNFQRIWGRFTWSLLLGTAAAACITVAPYCAPLVPYAASAVSYLPIVWPASVAAVYAAPSIASAANAAFEQIRKPLTQLNNAVPGAVVNGANLSFASVDPDYDTYHIESEEIDPTAYVHIRNLGTADPDRKNVKLLGIGNRFRIPTTFGQSGLAEAASIYKRIVKKQPYHSDAFSDSTWNALMGSVDNRFIEDLMPGWTNGIKIPDFQSWLNSRNYTLNLKMAYAKAWAQIKSGRIPVDDWTRKRRGCFVKMELNRKIGTPRAIQSGTIWDNAFKGPTCLGLGNLLSTTNGHNTAGPLYYVGGCTPEQIGRLFDRLYVSGHDIYEGDFEKYDSSQHRRIFDLRNRIYTLAGCSRQVIDSFAESMFTHGSTRKGNTYGVLATVTSGSMDTTVGNSVIQGVAIMRCLAEQLGSLQDVRDAGISVIVYGDDNLIIAPPNVIDYGSLNQRMTSLGFNLVGTVHQGTNAPYNATFCSQRFWPTSDGTVLGPCLFRAVSNLGWYCNPPTGVEPAAIVKGDAIGRLLQCSFIPILSHHWSRTLELAGNVTPVMPKHDHGFKGNEAYHSTTTDTWTMMKTVYGLTQVDVERYSSMLQQVTSLGSIADFAGFSHLCPNDDIIPTPVGSFTIDLKHGSTMQTINSILSDQSGVVFDIRDYTNFADDVTPDHMIDNIRGNRRHGYSELYAL